MSSHCPDPKVFLLILTGDQLTSCRPFVQYTVFTLSIGTPYLLTILVLKFEIVQSTVVIELGFKEMSTLVGNFVLSPREREKRDSRGDERKGHGRRNINDSEKPVDVSKILLYVWQTV